MVGIQLFLSAFCYWAARLLVLSSSDILCISDFFYLPYFYMSKFYRVPLFYFFSLSI